MAGGRRGAAGVWQGGSGVACSARVILSPCPPGSGCLVGCALLLRCTSKAASRTCLSDGHRKHAISLVVDVFTNKIDAACAQPQYSHDNGWGWGECRANTHAATALHTRQGARDTRRKLTWSPCVHLRWSAILCLESGRQRAVAHRCCRSTCMSAWCVRMHSASVIPGGTQMGTNAGNFNDHLLTF